MRGPAARIHKAVKGIRFRPRFTGTWEDRLSDLFDCGVDYAGKTVLDAGCNMGVIAYEISKRRPRFLHGIDRYRRAVTVARRIFLAVDVEHRFDVVNLLDERRVAEVLKPDYDIVLLLAVWQYLHRADPVRAEQFVRKLTDVCREAIVFRGLEQFGEQFSAVVIPRGFRLAFKGERKSRSAGSILVFRRLQSQAPGQSFARP